MIRRQSDDTAMTATMTIITLPAITISSPNADILQTSIAIRQHQLNICWLVVKLYKISLLLVSKNVLNTKNLVQNVTLEELTLYNTDIMVMSIPDICHGRHGRRPCKFFLAGVNFYRFNAKNWHF